MAMAMLIWFLLCVLVGVVADNRGRSAVGFFALSLVLSPLVGIVVLLLFADLKAQTAQKEREAREEAEREDARRREHEAHVASIQAIAAGRPASPTASAADEIAKLGDLLRQGLLTDEEFKAQKAIVLARGASMH